MSRIYILLFSFSLYFTAGSQTPIKGNKSAAAHLKRPKLVVGIVVDQMRWDYLYRYYDRYSAKGGFKRLLSKGFSCENTMIPYTPTVTACGHSSIYTGSVPAINGIVGNDWFDISKNDFVYCTSDENTRTIGSDTDLGMMSPRNLLVTTIGDELRLATNFRNKVIGIAIKDRGAILPAGHSANAAYWYDSKTGYWISSSYYMPILPKWVQDLNAQKWVDKYYQQDWKTLYPPYTYTQSAEDPKGFSHNLKQFAGKNYGMMAATPFGNSFSFEMAKAAVINEQLGMDSIPDLLALSLSSPDYIGHAYGPNSIEEEDCYLRLDKELGDFLDFLENKIGKDACLIFLTADHGAAHAPTFLKNHQIPAGNFDNIQTAHNLNVYLSGIFKTSKLVKAILNDQVYFNKDSIRNAGLNIETVFEKAIEYLKKDTFLYRVFVLESISQTTLNTGVKEMISNGYYPGRSGDLQIILRPQFIDGFLTGGTSHGSWNPYDSHIPLNWYGWNIQPGKTNREVSMTDIAATVAALLHIQMPSGCVGHVIEEITR